MSEYVLLSDSTTDLPPELAKELDVSIVPLSYIIDGVSYDDVWEAPLSDGTVSYGPKEFYDLMRAGTVVTSSQVNEHRFLEFFAPYLEKGRDIVFLAFSSSLSGTYEQAKLAAKSLLEKYPQRRITVVDSLTATMSGGLFLYLAAQKRKAGMLYDDLVSYMMSIRMKMQGWITVDDLQFLKRGGRLNAPVALVGGMLNIKPIITVDRLGKIVIGKVVRGQKKAMAALINEVATKADDPINDPICITHADAPDAADELKGMLKKLFNTKTIITNYLGPVLGSHGGPGTVGVYFLGKERTANGR
ncbi:MAG: DegV family protein [Coriobacteriia bacterium]|jgi:DegV family protein with EDD domain|nr:DegV family protein [Coriobacteriia bacterium]MDR2714522.1 DegV family protein [Coriobacteriales bacterium]